MKCKELSFILGGLFALSSLAFADSRVTVYNTPAIWIFDLIKEPTRIRNFTTTLNGQEVGGTQLRFGDEIECTINGKTKDFPKSGSEAQLALCSLRIKGDIQEILGQGVHGNSVGFDGPTAQRLFSLLPAVVYSIHKPTHPMFSGPARTETLRADSEEDLGTHGISCRETVPDAVEAAHPVTYSCAIVWQ